jgi:hypothetical protein
METISFKRLPCGNSDFRNIILQNYAYIDKKHISTHIEQKNVPILKRYCLFSSEKISLKFIYCELFKNIELEIISLHSFGSLQMTLG